MSASKTKLKKGFFLSLIVILALSTYGIVFANHIPVHIGECVPPQIPDPNGTCMDPPVDIFFEPIDTGESSPKAEDIYEFLQPLPGLNQTFDASQDCAFGKYLDLMIGIFIGIAAVLAMVMIVVGGLEYMTSELVSSKAAGKERILHAVMGLILALAAWIILSTLNPELLNLCLDKLPEGSIELSPEALEETIGVQGKTMSINGQTLTACNETEDGPGGLILLDFMGMQVRVNKAIRQDLQNVEAKWEETVQNLQKKTTKTAEEKYTIAYEINPNSTYGYSCRHVKNQPGKASAHAFGIALDVNSTANPFGKEKCVTDMPPLFVEAFTSNGFGWGGNWSSVYDAMHFSKAPNESKGQHLSGKSIFTNEGKVICPNGN